jgi:ribosome-associated protein
VIVSSGIYLAVTRPSGRTTPVGYRSRVADDGWLQVTRSCRIPIAALEWRVSRSGGPGGQHANTADTRVEVVVRVDESDALGPRQRARLLDRLGPVVTAVASDTRSQARNRTLALERLRSKLAEGLHVTPARRPTRPSASATTERLEQKRRRGEIKRRRRPPAPDD